MADVEVIKRIKRNEEKCAVCWNINKASTLFKAQNISAFIRGLMLRARNFFPVHPTVRLSFDLINFFCACLFISVPTILPHYLCNGNIFHFAAQIRLDCWQCHIFFMIQLIMFGLSPGQFLFVLGWQKAASEAGFGICRLRWSRKGQRWKGRGKKAASIVFMILYCISRIIPSLISAVQSTAFFMLR